MKCLLTRVLSPQLITYAHDLGLKHSKVGQRDWRVKLREAP
jgi:hypothetical protein